MNMEDFFYPLLKHYIKSPQWVKNTIGYAYSITPFVLRYGRSYSRFKCESKVESNFEDEIYDKLIHTLDWARSTVPFYQSLYITKHDNPIEYLKSFPIVSKDQIKNGLYRFLSTSVPKYKRLESFTGGSTANPMKFYLEKGVTRSKEFAYIQEFDRRAGIESNDVILSLRGRSVPGAGNPGVKIWMYEPIKKTIIFSSDHLEPKYMPEYVQALRAWKPTVIQAFPSAIFPLAKWFMRYPSPDITEHIKCIQLTSETVYDFQIEMLRTVFSCPILRHYGHSERILMASSLPDDDRYFFWPLYGYPEIIDYEGRPITRPGEIGELIGTGFDNNVMPFIRYKTGDLAMWSQEGHHLYKGWPVASAIIGRMQEFVISKDRRVISICTLGAAHISELSDVDEIQYEQYEIGKVVLKIKAQTKLSCRQIENIKSAFLEKTQGGCDIEVVEVQSIERSSRGKLQMIKQHLDLGEFFGAVSTEKQ